MEFEITPDVFITRIISCRYNGTIYVCKNNKSYADCLVVEQLTGVEKGLGFNSRNPVRL